MNVINDRIMSVLADKRIRQKDLCNAINIPASTLNTWLKQGRSIPSEFLIPICEFLEISVNWLLIGENEISKSTVKIQPKIYTDQELTTDEEVILETYREFDVNTKKEALKFMISKANFKTTESIKPL